MNLPKKGAPSWRRQALTIYRRIDTFLEQWNRVAVLIAVTGLVWGVALLAKAVR
jgi:hypothetical protein